MSTPIVQMYNLGWSPSQKRGQVAISLSDGSTQTLEFDDWGSFVASATLLREGTVYFDGGFLMTSWEEPRTP